MKRIPARVATVINCGNHYQVKQFQTVGTEENPFHQYVRSFDVPNKARALELCTAIEEGKLDIIEK